MSGLSKIAFLGAFLALVAAFAIQLMTGLWLNLNSTLLGLAVLLVVVALVRDWRVHWQFLTMRTTKHGMNMGLTILITVTVLVCLNYLANKHNKTWDVTHEHLNSLSEQSEKVLSGLSKDLNIKVFYKGPSAAEDKARVKNSLQLFQSASGRVHVNIINSYVDQSEAARYLNDQPDRDTAPLIGFAEYGDKRIRVDEAFDEAAVTSAIIRATREGVSKVYFIKGHGEKDLESDQDQGLKELTKALNDASFQTEALSLVDKKEIPADASAVAIIGPTLPYLDQEIEWLREYVRKGGHLFVALDPGQRHGLANLTKPLGVEFENNYVVTLLPIVGGGPATILGRTFSSTSEITKSLPVGAGFSVFPLASEVRAVSDKGSGIDVEEIVKSDDHSFTITDISHPVKPPATTVAVSLAVASHGTVSGEGSQPFKAVVFGDSDFLSNRGLMMGLNRDLALNAFAELANQKDLISIRPKLPQGTQLMLTTFAKWMVLILGLCLPLLLLISSGVMWYRRRGA